MYLEVLGKLGPSLIWRQIESHTFWCCGKLRPGILGHTGVANQALANWARCATNWAPRQTDTSEQSAVFLRITPMQF